MNNPILNTTILQILNRLPAGLKEKTLQNEVGILMDRPTLTTVEFEDSIRFLEDRGLIRRDPTLLGDTLFSITPAGRDALRGA